MQFTYTRDHTLHKDDGAYNDSTLIWMTLWSVLRPWRHSYVLNQAERLILIRKVFSNSDTFVILPRSFQCVRVFLTTCSTRGLVFRMNRIKKSGIVYLVMFSVRRHLISIYSLFFFIFKVSYCVTSLSQSVVSCVFFLVILVQEKTTFSKTAWNVFILTWNESKIKCYLADFQ